MNMERTLKIKSETAPVLRVKHRVKYGEDNTSRKKVCNEGENENKCYLSLFKKNIKETEKTCVLSITFACRLPVLSKHGGVNF